MIAHFLGDFVFQSNELILKKYKSWHGTLEHAAIVTAFTILLMGPYLGHARAWIVVGSIFAIHFVQDVLKVEYDKRLNKKKSIAPFFADQAGHLLLIFLIGRGFESLEPFKMPEWLGTIYFSSSAAILFVSLILVSYVLDIAFFQVKLSKNKNKELRYNPDYVGMLQRLMAFVVFYLFFFVLYHF